MSSSSIEQSLKSKDYWNLIGATIGITAVLLSSLLLEKLLDCMNSQKVVVEA